MFQPRHNEAGAHNILAKSGARNLLIIASGHWQTHHARTHRWKSKGNAELTAVEISATACRVTSKKVQMVVDTIED